MTKNNLKIVKTGKNQEAEVREKNKALEAAGQHWKLFNRDLFC